LGSRPTILGFTSGRSRAFYENDNQDDSNARGES
jgi:hypothetical protein